MSKKFLILIVIVHEISNGPCNIYVVHIYLFGAREQFLLSTLERICFLSSKFHQKIVQGLVNNADTDAIYLDFAKAFDKVDDRLLLLKMKRMGFHKKLIKWIESFLTNRKQCVLLYGVSSLEAVILSGVPQGTVLGPLLFILFINDMKLCVTGSIIRFFADDTRILQHIYSLADAEILQHDLNCVVKWAKCINMALSRG